MTTVEELVKYYDLQPHPEGGWYVQTYKSQEQIPAAALPERFGTDRPFSTAIYFLLETGNFSAFHRIKSDECWHFYQGDPLEIYILSPNGQLDMITLGNDNRKGQLFQYVVPAQSWFASRPATSSQFCLTGCTVAPGFDFADFELANAAALTKQFPLHAELIRQLCRQ